MERTITGFLGKRPPFSALPAAVLARMVDGLPLEECARGSVIWEVGDPASEAVVLRRGVLREGQGGPAERDVSLGLYGRGAVLGIGPILATPRGRAARHGTRLDAWEDCSVVRIDRAALLAAASVSADFGLALGTVAAQRAQRFESRVGAWLHRSAVSRLAALLLEIGEGFGVRDSRGLILPLRLPHRELASLIGVTRETASLALMSLRRAGWIEVEGKQLVIVDAGGLRRCWDDVGDGERAQGQQVEVMGSTG